MSVYKEGAEDSFTYDGRTWLINPFFERSADLPIVRVPVKDLEWVLKHDTPKPDRVRAADVSKPIMFTRDPKWGLVAIDGLHRLQKAVNLHLGTLPGREIPQQWFNEIPTISTEGFTSRYTVLGISPEAAAKYLESIGAVEPFMSAAVQPYSGPVRRLYYAAMDGDIIMGLCILQNHTRYSAGVWVPPQHRNLGVARLLLNDLRVDSITVNTDNLDGQRFLDHMGFHSEGGTSKYQVWVRYLPCTQGMVYS